MKKIENFEEIHEAMIELCSELNGIPKTREIKEAKLPDFRVIKRLYKENTGMTYIEYFQSKGYSIRNPENKRQNKYTYDEICDMWDNFFKKNNRYPNSSDCCAISELPDWRTVLKCIGDRIDEFLEKYDLIISPDIAKYEYYCNKIISYSSNIKRSPTINEINKLNGIPTAKWMIANCPDKNVKGYSDFLEHLGLTPNINISKELAVKFILEKHKKLNRNLIKDDFMNISDDEIGINIINRIWGTFNNMLKDLNLPINKGSTFDLMKSIEEMKNDIKKLCKYLYDKNGHKNISANDINTCEWCLSYGTYTKWFKRELNMSVAEYIESLGYIPNKKSMGMIYKFDDGEITTSRYEYNFSKFLRKNNIKYIRNILYKDFVCNYDGNKDCDYVIIHNNKEYYIEIAGMLKTSLSIEEAKSTLLHRIQQKYLKDLIEKDAMLKENNLKYLIVFPYHLKDMDFLFDFLNSK